MGRWHDTDTGSKICYLKVDPETGEKRYEVAAISRVIKNASDPLKDVLKVNSGNLEHSLDIKKGEEKSNRAALESNMDWFYLEKSKFAQNEFSCSSL